MGVSASREDSAGLAPGNEIRSVDQQFSRDLNTTENENNNRSPAGAAGRAGENVINGAQRGARMFLLVVRQTHHRQEDVHTVNVSTRDQTTIEGTNHHAGQIRL